MNRNEQSSSNDFFSAALALFVLDHELARQGIAEVERDKILDTLIAKTTVPATCPAVLALRNVHCNSSGSVDFKRFEDADRFVRLVSDKYPLAGYGTDFTVALLQGGGVRVRWQIGSAD